MNKNRLLLCLVLANVLLAKIACAGGNFQFLMLADGLPLGDSKSPVLAIMHLSGTSPYDHTDIASLEFTQQAEKYLGIIGPYLGEFDSTLGLNRIIEASDNSLGSTSDDPGNIGSLIIDGDPRVGVDAPPLFTTGDKFLTLSFFNEQETFSYITSPPTNRFVAGRWVGVIPEPATSSLLIGVLMMVLAKGDRLKRFNGNCYSLGRTFP